MSISGVDLKQRILALVENQKRTKIQWLATIVSVSEEEIIKIAPELDLLIENEFVINPQIKDEPKDLSKAEYDRLNPKPAPSFCEAKKSS
ncbi:MAG: hypothetical protein ACTSXA_13640 [Candidatus Heimdallarchaeota archaeon]